MAQTKVKLVSNGVVTVDNLHVNHGITTDHVGEGSVLYYTDARVQNYLTTNNYATEAYVSTTTTNSANWDTAFGWGNHASQGYATQTYVNTAVAGLVDAAPATLDTLNELAAALGDDPNFATTVSTSIGTKWTQDNAKISNWDTAYSWGNHASAGYLTSYTETDTLATVISRNQLTPTMWVNNSTSTYNNYNENIRLFPAANNISVIAFGASGAGGIPWNSTLGYSDRFEIRQGSQWQQRNYDGYVEAYGSFRSPVFYDSNNTGYYLNPDGFSNLDRATFNANWAGHSPHEGSINIRGNYPSMMFRNLVSNTAWLRHMDGSGSIQHYYVPDGYDSVNWTIKHTMQGDGTFFSAGSMRSPIFYDSNDTAYFVDPASTSRLNDLYIQGGVGGLSNSASYTEAAIEVRERGFGGAQDETWATAPRIGFHWGGRVASQIAMSSNGWINILNNPGNNYEGFRAGAIYSTGDVTAYYSDIRLKEIQGPIKNALNSVLSIDTFKYKNNDIAKQNGFIDDDVHIGVSAQSVEAVLPEVVKHAPFDIESKDGKTVSKTGEWYKTVQYEKLVPLLIEAIKEQQQQIDELKSLLNK